MMLHRQKKVLNKENGESSEEPVLAEDKREEKETVSPFTD